jgi:hypothetical protein
MPSENEEEILEYAAEIEERLKVMVRNGYSTEDDGPRFLN